MLKCVLSTAKLLNLFGWDEDVAEEYCRPILEKCDPERALEVFQELYDGSGQLPPQQDVIARATAPGRKVYLRAADGHCYVGDDSMGPEYACGCRKCRPKSWCDFPGCNKEPNRGYQFCERHKDGLSDVKPLPLRKPGKWEVRGIELADNPGGRAGFQQLANEMKKAGVHLAKRIDSGA
jgi:hypothetical protein